MNSTDLYSLLFDVIWDWDGINYALVPGQSMNEWMTAVQTDYDEIDRMLLDYETIGA